MTDARWIEVEDDLASACHHFGNAALLHGERGFERDDLAGYRASMALQHARQSAHTSLESALARILAIVGEEKPTGSDWHVTLVRRVSRPVTTPGHERPEILAPEIARDVDESRRFRHRATHGYDNFDPSLAAPSVEAAPKARDHPAARRGSVPTKGGPTLSGRREPGEWRTGRRHIREFVDALSGLPTRAAPVRSLPPALVKLVREPERPSLPPGP